VQCCDATDSKALFKVPNNGGYETTPEEEWNFVVNLDLAKTYPGGRRGTKLDVYNLAHGAQKHGGARLDIPLDVADNRLAEVAKQNACRGRCSSRPTTFFATRARPRGETTTRM
jgi:hypothetical protein